MSQNLTVNLIQEAIVASPYRIGGTFNTYFHLCDDALKVIEEATRKGYIIRLSHTQAQWTESGLDKARKELKLK